MIKHILLIAAVVGLIAQSSAFAADPTPTPPGGAAPSESPTKTHHHKTHHHKKATEPGTSPAPTATPS